MRHLCKFFLFTQLCYYYGFTFIGILARRHMSVEHQHSHQYSECCGPWQKSQPDFKGRYSGSIRILKRKGRKGTDTSISVQTNHLCTREKFTHEYFRMLSRRKFLLKILFVFRKTQKERTLKNFLLRINFPWDSTESKEPRPSHCSDWLLVTFQSSLRHAISKANKDQNSHWDALKQEIHLNRKKKSRSPSSSWTVDHQKWKEESMMRIEKVRAISQVDLQA